MSHYCVAVIVDEPTDEAVEKVSRKAQMEEYMFLGLRMKQGVTRDGFEKEFGIPPVVKFYSKMGKEWENKISKMETQAIINDYDSEDWCEEYRYCCYVELKKRFMNNEFAGTSNEAEADAGEAYVKEPVEIVDKIKIDDRIMEILGFPPKCPKEAAFKKSWQKQIESLSTSELLSRYDSEDWCEEYKYLCYIELSTREDLEESL